MSPLGTPARNGPENLVSIPKWASFSDMGSRYIGNSENSSSLSCARSTLRSGHHPARRQSDAVVELRRLAKQSTGDLPPTVDDAKDVHGIVSLGVSVDHDVRGDDAYANLPADSGARRPTVGEVGQDVVDLLEQRTVFDDSRLARLGVEVVEYNRRVGIRRRGDNDPRHLENDGGCPLGVAA